ncbi:Ig-specific serine endopeptidase MIP [Mycoplasma sp. Ms02]|uniref:Ig-specific serine endopeptidase MIP n=1 Tax=Mycoplasma sp. Ms02 TaxID=353851 RepID=UPI001C8922A2|nr:DUF31 family protein [Mycoplasma sp. Ms02]QZE12320.1 hypothetical protein K4L35_03235 [Mycoplasma sp. Ms02]
MKKFKLNLLAVSMVSTLTPLMFLMSCSKQEQNKNQGNTQNTDQNSNGNTSDTNGFKNNQGSNQNKSDSVQPSNNNTGSSNNTSTTIQPSNDGESTNNASRPTQPSNNGGSSNNTSRPTKPSNNGGSANNASRPTSPANNGGVADPGVVEDDSPVNPQRESRGKANNPTVPNISRAAYDKLSDSEKYRLDIDRYTEALEDATGADIPLPEDDDYDTKADAIKQPRFKEAYLRNFSYYDGTGLFLNPIKDPLKTQHWTATLYNGGKSRFLANDFYKQVANQTYSIEFFNNNEAKADTKTVSSMGTAWILDYKPTTDGSYPTTWYFATNLHVAEKLVKTQADSNTNYTNIINPSVEAATYNDYINKRDEAEKLYLEKAEPYNAQIEERKKQLDALENLGRSLNSGELRKKTELETEIKSIKAQMEKALLPEAIEFDKYYKLAKSFNEENTSVLRTLVLRRFNEETGVRQGLEITSFSPTVENYKFNPSQVKLIYAANDFLKTSPRSYLSSEQTQYHDLEEMADFAVIEVNFAGTTSVEKQTGEANGKYVTEQADAQTIARMATGNYADTPEKQIRFSSKSIFNKYDELVNEKVKVNYNDRDIDVSRMLVNFVAVGFPRAKNDYSITDNDVTWKYKGQSVVDTTSSLWTNKPRDFSSFTYDKGNGLTKTLAFRNFTDKPGLTDILITQPLINSTKEQGFSINNVKDKTSNYQGSRYINYGLGINPTAWSPFEGASGSSFRDYENTVYGINYAVGDSGGVTGTSFVQAFRSEGIDYNGFYGKYNLEQYDLIYGGGKNQRTSFREAILAAYGSSYKTNLFKEGAGVIPQEFRFNK